MENISKQKQHIGGLFDRIARHYDGLNHLLSLGIDRCWRRQAVGSMQPVDHVLDVAVGTGDLALLLLRRGKAQRVTGIDLSTEMMRAQEMPFPDASFDAVTCAYGVRNFADLDAGLSEMYHVLRPGGELTILEFGYPRQKWVRRVYDWYFSTWLPMIGRLLSRDKTAYTYLNQSVRHFCYADDFLEHLKNVGFQGTYYRPQTFGISYLYKAQKLAEK